MAHVEINKAKGGYIVNVKAGNSENLTNSEVLKTKDSCFKNIAAQINAFDAATCIVHDNTNTKVYCVFKNGAKRKL